MKTSKRKSRTGSVFQSIAGATLLVAVAITLSIGTAQAEFIYQEDFDGFNSAFLNGTAPRTVSGSYGTSGATWLAAEPATADFGFRDDGHVYGVAGGYGAYSAFLPFVPTGGTSASIYQLDVGLTHNVGRPASLGFNPGYYDTTSRPMDSGMVAYLSTAGTSQQYYYGDGTMGTDTAFDGSVLRTYSVILDMTAGANNTTVEFLVDGISQNSKTGLDFSGANAINQIQLSIDYTYQGTAGTSADYGSLTLSQIPEPASLGLVVMGAIVLMRRRLFGNRK